MTNLHEARVDEAIRALGPKEARVRLLAENDALIRQPQLDNGREIVAARSAVPVVLVRHWAAAQQRASGYDKPFAVVALGGTGRAELSPLSDLDFAFVFDDVLEGNRFLLELQRQILHSSAFEDAYGFSFQPLPFNLDDPPRLSGKQLNAYIDLQPVYDPGRLVPNFRERIRATYDPFEHFLHVQGFWKGQWEKAAGECERVDRFDIKNDGLRVFLAGIWTLAGKSFVHSHEVYQTLEDPRDLLAYDFLLRIRSFIHSRRAVSPPSQGLTPHPGDVLGFDDFTSFGDLLGPDATERARHEFANDVRARLLSARRRVARFTKAVIERELKEGRVISPGSPIVYGVAGLHHSALPPDPTPHGKSRAALALLLASQRYGVPIDPLEWQGTFRNAGDWLVRVPELSALFYEHNGSLADSFAFLSQCEGAEDRLFPGYGRFEAALDGRVMAERRCLRGPLERQKMRALEQLVHEGRAMLVVAVSAERLTDLSRGLSPSVEAALLDADHLAAVKLALKTKRLPLTDDDRRLQDDPHRPFHERFSTGMSGIPLDRYYEPFGVECDFTPETLRVAEFLVAHRRAFKERAVAALNDSRQVEEFARICHDEHRLRSLFVFTCADRADWESEREDPARWFNTRELYCKTMLRFKPGLDPTRSLETAGFSADQLRILKDFGVDFFAGVYRQYANRFGAHLVRLHENPNTGPRASLLRDGTSVILSVAARDYRGLAATITGALWHQGAPLRQAHLFSAANHRLALDFFHISPGSQPLGAGLTRSIEDAIRSRLYIHDTDEANLPPMRGTATLQEWRPGQYCLRFDTTRESEGLVYALTYRVFRHLGGNIFGLAAHATRGSVYVSVYHSLPHGLSLEHAQQIVADRFCPCPAPPKP